ncbi:MAG: flavin reductase family protein [Blautia sp.]|nr:flavin reductase family protein [Blautia sp.]MDY5030364.1 flavin reductase family protein [Blautia sp.]
MAAEIGKFEKISSPNPFALITSKKEDGTTNIMALSWWTYCANKPVPTIAICLSSRGFSGQLIQKTGEFGLSLPDESIAQAAMMCGRCSGRDVNKPEEFGIELMDSVTMETKLIAKSQAAMECKVVQVLPVQDHLMFIAQVQETHFRDAYRHVSSVDGYAKLEVR